jgi:glycosyltransferase involved in cell wall biosynthesis
MNKENNSNSPLLSICIPTFNRANCLDNLLINIEKIILKYGSDIEICISNNNSTDDTAKVIEKWKSDINLKIINQSDNIGGTKNFIAVSALAKGKWIMLIGDDDEFITSNFGELISVLRSAEESVWVLVGVADKSGKEILLGNITSGRYSASKFRRTVIQTGLYRFGFIGMHVFPAVDQPILASLAQAKDTIKMRQHWPHIYVLMQHIQSNPVYVIQSPIVVQEPGGTGEFWTVGNWVRICLQKLNMISNVRHAFPNNRVFYVILLIRELYSKRNIKEIILWKALDPKDFNENIFQEVYSRYMLFGPLIFFTLVHFLFILFLYIIPASFVLNLMSIFGYRYIKNNYLSKMNEKASQLNRATNCDRLDS